MLFRSREEILAQALPLPPEDFLPQTIEEQIISWADLFFSKIPERAWQEKSIEEVRQHVVRYGERQCRLFEEWLARFGE